MNEATMAGQDTSLGRSRPVAKDKFADNFTPKAGHTKPANFNANRTKNARGKKKTKKSRKLLIFLISFVILVAGAIAALYFSGLLMPLMQYAGIIDEIPVEITLQEREKLLDKRKDELSEKEDELRNLEATLLDKQIALEQKEGSTVTVVPFEEALGDLSESKLKEIKSVGLIYSKMDAESAAKVLARMHGNQEIALILYHMKPAAAASVLEKMDATLAATITKLMLG